MDLHKLTSDEVRSWEAAKRRETEHEIRKALADIRMDIYTARAQNGAKLKGLKKSLARIKTVDSETRLKAAQPAAKA